MRLKTLKLVKNVKAVIKQTRLKIKTIYNSLKAHFKRKLAVVFTNNNLLLVKLKRIFEEFTRMALNLSYIIVKHRS